MLAAMLLQLQGPRERSKNTTTVNGFLKRH
jgi:hypothetical protein